MPKISLSIICRALLLVAFALILGSVSGTELGRVARGYPRTNRGFKNAQLSTARGFGKRDGGFKEGPSEEPSASLPVLIPYNSRTVYPNSWLVEELQSNPELARRFVDKYVDENGNGGLTPEEIIRKFYF